jgi:mitochondrial fission protein ELM1
MTVVQFEDTDQDWMMEEFSRAGQIWVTPDSVSMVYESLSSGAEVRVFSMDTLHPRNQSRIGKGLNDLIEESYISTFEQWNADPSSTVLTKQFNESDRVAKIVMEQLS